MTNQQSTKH